MSQLRVLLPSTSLDHLNQCQQTTIGRPALPIHSTGLEGSDNVISRLSLCCASKRRGAEQPRLDNSLSQLWRHNIYELAYYSLNSTPLTLLRLIDPRETPVFQQQRTNTNVCGSSNCHTGLFWTPRKDLPSPRAQTLLKY